MRSLTVTSQLTSGCSILELFSRVIVGGHVMHDNAQRPLSAREFEAMMREFDEAKDWMLDQLRQRRLAQEPPQVPVESNH